MCFSAQASFITGLALFISGSISCYLSKKTSYTLLAITPMLFALQQWTEGIIWYSLQNELPGIATMSTYIYLLFAGTVWPWWISRTLLAAETKKIRRMLLTVIKAIGDIFGLIVGLCILLYGAQAFMGSNHIIYVINTAQSLYGICIALYLLTTAVPFLISSIPYAWIGFFGITISYFLSYYFYYYALGSIWCFCAAFLSFFIIFVIYNQVYRS